MDVITIAALHKAAFGHAGAHGWHEADFAKAMADPAFSLVAVESGYAVARRVLDEAELVLIATTPMARRKGVATGLLARLESDLIDKGVIRIMLEVVATNTAAIDFYLRQGFQQSGRRNGYYGPGHDALLFEKSLKT
ncbi:MAG: GNAT family N-acetyltransferase [Pseudomonadota bacterium]